MQTKRIQMLLLAAFFLLMAGATQAVAGPRGGGYDGYGMDCGGCPMMGDGGGQGMGMGPGMMGHGRNRSDDGPALSKEQEDKLDATREKFWTENRQLRNQIRDKQDELYDELAKETVDEAKVTALQKELSKLQGEFDLKTIQHKMEVHKIAPDLFRGRYRGHGPGGGDCRQ